MYRKTLAKHIRRIPEIETGLAVASPSGTVSRQVRQQTECVYYRHLNASELDFPYDRWTIRRWNSGGMSSPYPVMEIETIEHKAIVVDQDGYVKHLKSFEGIRVEDETIDRNGDGDEPEEEARPLREFLPPLERVRHVIVVTKTESRFVEVIGGCPEDGFTHHRAEEDRIRYEVLVLRSARH
jgi:hypothetical protein